MLCTKNEGEDLVNSQLLWSSNEHSYISIDLLEKVLDTQNFNYNGNERFSHGILEPKEDNLKLFMKYLNVPEQIQEKYMQKNIS